MLVRVRRIDWPMLADALKAQYEYDYSVLGTHEGWVFLKVSWALCVVLNKLGKEQKAKLILKEAA